MENTQIAKREELGDQSFIERLVSKAESLEQVKEVGMVIINSGFCPQHFKDSKDAVGVIMCIEAGKKLGISWMQSLSDIYPVKGRTGIMGTLAKSLIFSSGVLESWREKSEGTYPNPDYKYTVTSKRKGFPDEFTTEFSVFDARTAGLMDKQIYKTFGKRMIMWRCIGFHASDYYGDLLKGMKTVEELNDYDPSNLIAPDGKTTLLTQDGKELKIDSAKQGKSENISQSVKDKIDKANGKHKEEPVQEAEIVPDETLPENEPAEVKPKVYTEEDLLQLGNGIVEVAKEVLPEAKRIILDSGTCGKRTKRLFVDAIIAHQNGNLDKWMDAKLKEKQREEPKVDNPPTQTEKVPPVNQNEGKIEGSGGTGTEDIDKVLESKQTGISGKEAVDSFESQKQTPPQQTGEYQIPELDNGVRPFQKVVELDRYLLKLGITEETTKMSTPEWNTLMKTGSVDEISALIKLFS